MVSHSYIHMSHSSIKMIHSNIKKHLFALSKMITNNTLFGTKGYHSDDTFLFKSRTPLRTGVRCYVSIAHLHSSHFQIIDNLADDKKIYLQQGGNHFFIFKLNGFKLVS